jgi:serine/threonine protein kinase
LEELNGVHALVMEIVDGFTLDQIIVGSKLQPGEALYIAKQIADASRPRTSGASSIETSNPPTSR